MIIAIPVTEGRLSGHFGHCDQFLVYDVKDSASEINCVTEMIPPPHEPGVIPKWLYENGVNVVIAGGIGAKAKTIFEKYNIEVLSGADNTVEVGKLVEQYINGSLETSDATCNKH
jgi:predicted Fe-Mo cluster-binding NifX family protein